MEYYKITLLNLPDIIFAHKYETKSHEYSFNPRNDFLEITYIDTGKLSFVYNDCESMEYPEKSIHAFPGPHKGRCTSNGIFHRHFTVGISAKYKHETINAEDILKYYRASIYTHAPNNIIIIPKILTNNPEAESGAKLIREIILNSSSDINTIKCTSRLFELFNLLTTYSINDALSGSSANISFDDSAYCRRAIKYISANIQKKITVPQIAQSLGISAGHLSRVFKSVTKNSIIDYVNKMKIDIAREIISVKDAGILELSQSSGIADEKYFCRLFKKYTGMTVGEYKSMQKTIPLKII